MHTEVFFKVIDETGKAPSYDSYKKYLEDHKSFKVEVPGVFVMPRWPEVLQWVTSRVAQSDFTQISGVFYFKNQKDAISGCFSLNIIDETGREA